MKDGSLAASSARKLDKGGYSLKEQTRVGVHASAVGEDGIVGRLIEEVLSIMSVDTPVVWPTAWQSA